MSENLLDMLPKLFAIMDEVKREQKENPKEGSLYLLGAFRHKYENSHSDIIANLLNPKESHMHCDEFLRMFFEHIDLNELAKIKDLSDTRVTKECYIWHKDGDGRIDILLKHDDFTVIIENKIEAEDQEGQLSRYYDTQKVTEDKIHVVYLTPDERYPSDKSLGGGDAKWKKLRKKLEKNLTCIAYNYHIINWLENINKKLYYCKEPLLKSGVEQYLYAVKVITNQLEEDNAMKDKLFQELITKSDEYSVGDLQNLLEAVNSARNLYPLLKVQKHFTKNKMNIKNLYIEAENSEKSIKITDLQTNLCKGWVSLYIQLAKIRIAFYIWKGTAKDGKYTLEISGLSFLKKKEREDIQKIIANKKKDGQPKIYDGATNDTFEAYQYDTIRNEVDVGETIKT